MLPHIQVAHLLPVLVLALLAPSFTAAYTAEYKYKKLQTLPKPQHKVISLDADSFNLVTESPRNYSIAIVLTSLDPSIQCAMCHTFDPVFHYASYSWSNHPGSKHPLYFATLDFVNGRSVFINLQLNTAPNLYLYPANTGPSKLASRPPNNAAFFEYDLSRKGFGGDDLVEWIGQTIGEPFAYQQPPDYTLYAIFTVLVILTAIFRKQVYQLTKRILCNPKIYALLSLASILLFTGGYMWNTIRTPPFVASDQGGHPEYIAKGVQQQYGIETQLSALLHGLGAFSVVALTVGVPKLPSGWLQRVVGISLLVLMLGSYSIVMRMFATKSPNYPFKLLF